MKENSKSYHHKNLKEALITQGIEIIYTHGMSSFSLRKLSREVGVSAAACYNHFANVDELLKAMIQFITDKFTEVLKQAALENKYKSVTISMGCAYVKFFLEYPHYFSFLFDSNNLGITVTYDGIVSDGSFEPFTVFEREARNEIERLGISKEELRNDLLIMWASVHGLAAMANMKGIALEGDFIKLTEKLLRKKVTLWKMK